MSRLLLTAATCLAALVIGLGAYVRLADAGLGCPDWPGCYGHYLGVPATPQEQAAAIASFPGSPLDHGKAWKEMLHRYLAGSLGVLIAFIFARAWQAWRRGGEAPWLPGLLLLLVCLQAALGMWTVTWQLKPVIVCLHLLGGMGTLALLLTLRLRHPAAAGAGWRLYAPPRSLRLGAALALLAVIGQIALGGWVSSHYASLACTAFPACNSGESTAMDFALAFSLGHESWHSAGYQALPDSALTAIHWSHRLGALLVSLCVLGCIFLLGRHPAPACRRWQALLLALLGLQLALGLANVLLSLPLGIAVAHTLGAAALLGALVAFNLVLQAAEPAPDKRTG